MLLSLEDSGTPMKLVYQAVVALRSDPKKVALAQALTQDKSRPQMGLKGNLGLYGSQQWWDSIEQGKMPLRRLSGIISDVYTAGQDRDDPPNTIDLQLSDGLQRPVGIYVNNESDRKLYQIGSRLEIVYALDELKLQPGWDGGVNYLEIPLEVAVSRQPVRPA